MPQLDNPVHRQLQKMENNPRRLAQGNNNAKKDGCETTLVDIMLNTTERTIGAVTNSHPAILLGATGRKSAKQPVHMEIVGYSVN